MSCSNCYNGCQEITSDKCVKYTGVNIPLLGIQNGDSLSYVEQSIIGFLSSTLDGSGIKPDMSKFDFCTLVSAGLPECGDITILDIEQAIATAICTVNDLLTQLTSTVDTINTGYDVGCLTSETITNASSIHEILQELIDRFCIIEANLTALTADVTTNYVKLADLNKLIQDYLNSIFATTLICEKMVPYSILPWYGDPSGKFDATGAGINEWLNIYLCNGDNSTPDLRGRVPVGVTNMFGAVPVDPVVASPVYTLGTAIGTNTVSLSTGQLATHSHTATPSVNDNGHFHYEFADVVLGTSAPIITSTLYPPRSVGPSDGASNLEYQIAGSSTAATLGKTSDADTGITVDVDIADAGSGEAHNNYQPGLGCYYIIYIP